MKSGPTPALVPARERIVCLRDSVELLAAVETALAGAGVAVENNSEGNVGCGRGCRRDDI